MRRVCLVIGSRFGEVLVRGHQLAPALRQLGLVVDVVRAKHFGAADVRDSLVVFVKHADPRRVELARAKGNLVVWNVCDRLVFEEKPEAAELFHGILFPSAAALRAELPGYARGACAAVMHSHADARWQPHHADGFRLGYLGSEPSLGETHRRLPELEVELLSLAPLEAQLEAFFRRARSFSCHFSVRDRDSRDFRYKPCTKLIGAAAAHANIVLSRDASNLELLDAGYPYFTEGDLPSVRETIARAREDYGTAAWREGLDMLRAVRERTTLARIARDYQAFFAELEGRQPGHVGVFVRRAARRLRLSYAERFAREGLRGRPGGAG